MSRKARPRKNNPEPDPIEQLEPATDTRHQLDPEAQQMLDSLIMMMTPLPPPDLDSSRADDSDDDSADEVLDHEVAMVLASRVMTRALLARLLGREPNSRMPNVDLGDGEPGGDGELGTGEPPAFLDAIMRSLTTPDSDRSRQSREQRQAVMYQVSELVREVGLEEFDVDCDIQVDRHGSGVMFSAPVTSELAHVLLLDNLFDRLETSVTISDPFVSIERDASEWEFMRWSVAPPPGMMSEETASATRALREIEFSLVERRTLALGTSIAEDLVADEDAVELFPRQYQMAKSYVLSSADIYECVAIDEYRAQLRSLTDGTLVSVREHTAEVDYGVGWIAFGRLLPFGKDGAYLRSPGMIVVEPITTDLADRASDAFREYLRTLPGALAVEAVISTVLCGVAVPRENRPTPTRAYARETLEDILQIVEGTEWADALMPIDGDEESGVIPIAAPYYVPSQPATLDSTVSGYWSALLNQARAGSDSDERRRTKKSTKAKRRW
jgi:hypothetical protein